MKKRKIAVSVLIIVAASLLMQTCQALFTMSPFSFLQRPASSLNYDQLLNYADQVLNSNDPAALQNAYNALQAMIDSLDPATQMDRINALRQKQLDIALKSSGIESFLLNTMSSIDFAAIQNGSLDLNATIDTMNSMLSVIDPTSVDNAVAVISLLEGNGTSPTTSQYLFASMALVANVAKDLGSVEDVHDVNLTVEQQTDLNLSVQIFNQALASSESNATVLMMGMLFGLTTP